MVTKKGKKKELQIVGSDGTSMKKIQWSDGGQVPSVLEGMWTHETPARQAITSYLANREIQRPKQVTNVTELASGTK